MITLRERIAHCEMYALLLPADPMEGTEGEGHLEIAIALGKPILVLRLPERRGLALPRILDGYDNLIIIDGSVDQIRAELAWRGIHPFDSQGFGGRH